IGSKVRNNGAQSDADLYPALYNLIRYEGRLEKLRMIKAFYDLAEGYAKEPPRFEVDMQAEGSRPGHAMRVVRAVNKLNDSRVCTPERFLDYLRFVLTYFKDDIGKEKFV